MLMSNTENAAVAGATDTDVGSYFVANYPPFSVWTPEAAEDIARPALSAKPADIPLGLYLHIPFCRKRCHFCYFRVYTDKNASEVQAYLDTLAKEWELYGSQPAIAERPLDFIYFGGGTPSFLSVRQLQGLVDRLSAVRSWSTASEITFECEPGTLTEAKLRAIRNMGVTRLSLGIEHFDDEVLQLNGRAHRSAEIFRAYEFARTIGFPQINIDLIAGMLGDTNDKWNNAIEQTLALEPDSVTIYQMELPFNTTISSDLINETGQFTHAVASWETKRRWVDEAFAALEQAGYTIGSAYTAVKDPAKTTFVYRDRLWQGADLAGLGVASFGHINGVHMQNLDSWGTYAAAVEAGNIPLNRAYRPTDEERLIRELVLQLKRGSIRPDYFKNKYHIDVQSHFKKPFATLKDDGYLAESSPDIVQLSRDGLLRVDSLLPRFFLPAHTEIRYT